MQILLITFGNPEKLTGKALRKIKKAWIVKLGLIRA